ncbi:metallophosphoesterase [Bacillaceae bacterium Marseille-Q3522]|nr:metallophosphoesterase [Bacillaceae bacterium Marseille-Q3522]
MKLKLSKQKIIFSAIVIPAILIILSVIVSNTVLQVSHYEISSGKIHSSFDGYKILQLSDLHSSSYGRNHSGIIKKVDREDPDIVVMTGDMIDTKDTDYHVFYQLAQQLADKYPVFFIVGNHEQNIAEQRLLDLTDYLTSIGVHILDNEKITLSKGEQSIDLYGLWFNLRYYKDLNNKNTEDYYFGNEQIETVLGSMDDEKFTVLLAHNPVYFDTYAEWGADLVFSGHIHGGIIRIPFVGGLLSPERVFFPEYDAGIFAKNDKQMIVSRGLGNSDFGFRVFNRPEIVVVTLKRK